MSPNQRVETLIKAQEERDKEAKERRQRRQQAKSRKSTRNFMSGRVFRPKENTAFNPLRAFPRNASCFCGSLKKAKRCCLPRLLPCIGAAKAKYIHEHWNEIVSGLVKVNVKTVNFVTPAQAAEIKKAGKEVKFVTPEELSERHEEVTSPEGEAEQGEQERPSPSTEESRETAPDSPRSLE